MSSVLYKVYSVPKLLWIS